MNVTISRRNVLRTGVAVAGTLVLAGKLEAAASKRQVVIWSDGPGPVEVYPKGMNSAIADGLKPLEGWDIVSATFADPEQGLSDAVLDKTDVLLWWGKWHHKDVEDKRVERIARRVKEDGMGLIVIHSGHAGKPFKALMGTPALWKAGAVDDSAVKVIVKDGQHPIASGIKDFVITRSERYSEPFDVPAPQSVVFDGLFTRPDGTTEASRQGLTWQIGKGKIFYFQPGHETYPNFLQPEVLHILRNAVQWAAPQPRA